MRSSAVVQNSSFSVNLASCSTEEKEGKFSWRLKELNMKITELYCFSQSLTWAEMFCSPNLFWLYGISLTWSLSNFQIFVLVSHWHWNILEITVQLININYLNKSKKLWMAHHSPLFQLCLNIPYLRQESSNI